MLFNNRVALGDVLGKISSSIKEAITGTPKEEAPTANGPAPQVGTVSGNEVGARQGNAELGRAWWNVANPNELDFDPNQIEVGTPNYGFLTNTPGRGQVTVAVIDDFSADGSGGSAFNHGQTMRSIIENGGSINQGAVAQNAPPINTLNYHIDTGNGGDRSEWVLNALNDIHQRLNLGLDIDAVNISQQDFENSDNNQRINAMINLIQSNFGVPVVVAAGNEGPESNNVLANGALFRVENSAPGSDQRTDSSGIGNIRSEGAFTSQATANVSARAAQLRDLGYSLSQIEFIIQREAFNEGGSLDAAPNNPINTRPGQVPADVIAPETGAG